MKKFLLLFTLFFFGLLNFNLAGAKEKSCVRGGVFIRVQSSKKRNLDHKNHTNFQQRNFHIKDSEKARWQGGCKTGKYRRHIFYW